MSQSLSDLAMQVAVGLRDNPDCPRCKAVLSDPEVGSHVQDVVDRIFESWSENDASHRKNSQNRESNPYMVPHLNHRIEVVVRQAHAFHDGHLRMIGAVKVKVSKRRANRKDVSEPERLPDMREGMSKSEWRTPTQRNVAFEYSEEETQFIRHYGLDAGRKARDRSAGIVRVKPEDVPMREQSSERSGRSVADGLSADDVSATYWDTTDGSWTGK